MKLDIPDDCVPLLITALEQYYAHTKAVRREDSRHQQAADVFHRQPTPVSEKPVRMMKRARRLRHRCAILTGPAKPRPPRPPATFLSSLENISFPALQYRVHSLSSTPVLGEHPVNRSSNDHRGAKPLSCNPRAAFVDRIRLLGRCSGIPNIRQMLRF
jgi:hypothetical protein